MKMASTSAEWTGLQKEITLTWSSFLQRERLPQLICLYVWPLRWIM